MNVTDPIADMLTRVRNAVQARHRYVLVPASNIKTSIARIMREEGYVVKTASGYNCRYVSGTKTWSNHAWGLAVDINYPDLGRRRTTNSTLLSVANRVMAIRAYGKNGRADIPVFKWGQYFSNPDPAHWQVCCGPEDIARGLKVPGIWTPM